MDILFYILANPENPFEYKKKQRPCIIILYKTNWVKCVTFILIFSFDIQITYKLKSYFNISLMPIRKIKLKY